MPKLFHYWFSGEVDWFILAFHAYGFMLLCGLFFVSRRLLGVRNGNICDMTDDEIAAVCYAVKNFEVELTEPLGMDSAQVTAGGVRTEEFDPATMESKLIPGLYACGEVLDIDGDCGGFNLQWAWSSGRLAGLSAGKDMA